MHAAPESLPNEAQPGNPRVRRFSDLSLHVEMKDRLRVPGALFGQASLARISHSRRPIPDPAITHEVNARVITVRRPMTLKVIKECDPVVR